MTRRNEAQASDAERILDELLQQWILDRQLSEAKSETIRQSLMQNIATTPTEFTYAWWRRLFQQGTYPRRGGATVAQFTRFRLYRQRAVPFDGLPA